MKFLISIATVLWAAHLYGASLSDFGAAGDGITDDTDAFRRAIEAAGKGANILHIPQGRYLVRGDIMVSGPIEFAGIGRDEAIITSNGALARFLVSQSGTTFRNLGFENMVEPIALVSRSGYMLENILIERCRFEDLKVNDGNRGVIGLSSGNSAQRPYRIRNIKIRGCLFRRIDASAINIRANVSSVRVINNQFFDLVSSRSDEESPLGGYAIRLGESSDDAGLVDLFAAQGRHYIKGNIIRTMRKATVRGNLKAMLLYGNHTVVHENLIEDIDGTEEGDDVNAMYIRGSHNRISENTIRNIRGADDDGALCFKGGLDLGSVGNIVIGNRIEEVHGMSAIEASTSELSISGNTIRNASIRGVRHRGGDGLFLEKNLFQNANTDLRTEGGNVVIAGNRYVDSMIWISQRRSHPSRREGVRIHGNSFIGGSDMISCVIRLGNGVEEQFVSISDNRFQTGNSDDEILVDLVSNGMLQRVEIRGNHVLRKGSSDSSFRIDSPEETITGNRFGPVYPRAD